VEQRAGERRHVLLQPWAVQRALSRGWRRLSAKDIAEIKRSTCVFRAKSATDSGMKSATDSDLISAIPI